MSQPFSLCVYCGSRRGEQPNYMAQARAVGTWLGERGGRLIYGGGKVGLMGVVADAALKAGGSAVGIIPRSLMNREVGHHGLTELHVVETMHERKRMMAERADAFLALPGGLGTMEELFEVWTWRQLGYHDQPMGLLNVDGYYDGLLTFLDHMTAQGFVTPQQVALLTVEREPAVLLPRLQAAALKATAPDDFRKV